MNWAWAQDAGRDKLLLLAVADHAGDDGTCYPGQARLAAKCGITDRAVRDGMKRLEKSVGLVRERRNDARGHRTSDLYRLPLPEETAAGEGESLPEVDDHPYRKPTSGESSVEPSASSATPSSPPSLRNGEPPPFKVSIPQDAPMHWHVIAEVARAKGAKLTPEGLAKLDNRYADRAVEIEAHRFNDYWLSGMGENRPMKAAAQSWRNWLERAPSRAARQRAVGQRQENLRLAEELRAEARAVDGTGEEVG